MSVTAPPGFRAAGVAAGIKASGHPDVAVVINDGSSAAAAGVFTSNRVKAAPVLWSQQVLAGGSVRAVILNSGGANACTGPDGFQDTHQTAEHVASLLGIGAAEVAVCSTGLIGERLPLGPLMAGAEAAVHAASADGGTAAAEAIRTTDTVAKTVVKPGAGYVIGGMGKGAAMLAPALATMLVVLTTDADLPAAALDGALREAVGSTFDRLDTDGCMSTNDTVLLLASGAAGVAPDLAEFTALLTAACADLAGQMQQDAEGASKAIAIEVINAASMADAVRGRPRHRPVQPAQVRDRRRGSELGPGAGGGRHDERGVRAGRAGGGDQRCLGLPERRPGRRPVQGEPQPQGRDHHGEPERG